MSAPPGVSGLGVVFPRGVAASRCTLPGFRRLSELLSARPSRTLVLRRPASSCRVTRPWGLQSGDRFGRYRPNVSLRLGRPLRVLAAPPVRTIPVVLASPPGVSPPLQRRERQGPYHPGLPHPARSALGVLSPLDGFLPCHLTVSGTVATHGVSSSRNCGPCVRCVPGEFPRPGAPVRPASSRPVPTL